MSKPEQGAKTVHVRLPEPVHTRLAEWATRERRSITQSVALLVEQALDTEQEKS